MRCTFVVLLAVLVAGCSAPERPSPPPLAVPILVSDAHSGLVANAPHIPVHLGARNVRVLLVRGPSIVRLREVFVPEGETVTAVRWTNGAAALIVETGDMRFALDPATGRLARLAPDARGLAARSASPPRG